MKINYKLFKLKKAMKLSLSLLPVIGAFSALNAQVINYTFTPAGATGRLGPTQAQVNSAYLATNLNGLVVTTTPTSGIQTFTIPAGVTSVTIEAMGAQGGSVSGTAFVGGLGARMKGTFAVVPGNILNIVVGQFGLPQTNGNCNGGGGGGGSFVYLTAAAQPMIAAGGGGGAHQTMGPGTSGTVSTTAATSASVSGTPGAGGTGGGAGICGSGWPGAGGGGWSTAGGNGCLWSGQPTEGGYSQFSWLGGLRNPNTTQGSQGQDGSFGGGGGAFHGAGGGGGYSGGGGGGSCSAGAFPLGGGGGSYNVGTNQTNTSGIQAGNGLVIVSMLSCAAGATPTNATPANNQNICVNNTTTLNVTGTGTLNWYATPVSSVVLGTGSVYVTPTLAVGNYTYYAASTNTCSEGPRAPITITVNAAPSVAVAGPTAAICAGSAANLTASGAATYSWNNGAVTSTIAPTPTANASYTVVGTNSVGCSASAVVAVSVTAAPSVSIAGAGTICIGNATVLTASGANTYSWNTGATTSTISVSPTVNTTYTAMGTSSVTGCSGMITANIVVSPCTGISTVSSKIEGLSIYPNPSLGDFTVELNNGLNKTIQVLDATGKIVSTNTSSKDKTNINITHLSSGIYFVKIQSNNATEVIKVVKH